MISFNEIKFSERRILKLNLNYNRTINLYKLSLLRDQYHQYT